MKATDNVVKDPEFGLLEKAGEIVSRMSLLGDSLKGFAADIEKRVTLERCKRSLRTPDEAFEPIRAEITVTRNNGAYLATLRHDEKSPRAQLPFYASDANPYDAAANLLTLIHERRAWG